jgi:hypothetical protein
MTKHLHPKEIWFKPTASTTSLQDKSVLIVHPDGEEQPLHIQVKSADPNGPNAGMVALRVWQTWTDKVQFKPISASSRPPTSQIHVWEAFLDPALIDSLSPCNSGYDFFLHLNE